MRIMMRPSATFFTVVLAVVSSACTAKEKQTVTVSYAIRPTRPLPEGLKSVAVIDAGVETRGLKQDDREKRWSLIAADMIEAMLQNGGQRFGGGPAVANRRLTQQILMEKDLKLSGLVQKDQATRAGKLLDVQGLITAVITINIDTQRSTRSQVDWVSVFGGVMQQQMNREPRRRDPVVYRDPYAARRARNYYGARPVYPARPGQPVYAPQPATPAPGPYDQGMPVREVEEISRHLSVQCSFALVDAVTGEILLQHAPPPAQKKDKASPNFFFGGMADESKLDPADHFIGELVERATVDFVGMLVPVQVEYSYELIGRGKKGEAAIRALRGDDYAAAYELFQQELRSNPDKFETAFAVAVAAELAGRPEEALQLYRQAAQHKEADKEEAQLAMSAARRLADHLPRMIRAVGQPGAPATQPGGAPQ